MTNKQLPSDKKAIKWGLILGIVFALWAGPILAYTFEGASFGQTENHSLLSSYLPAYSESLRQSINNKENPIVGEATFIKFWYKTESEANYIRFALGFETYDNITNELVGQGVIGGFCGSIWLTANSDEEKILECYQLPEFLPASETTYTIYFLIPIPSFWPKLRGADVDLYPYGVCFGDSYCNGITDIYFEITGNFDSYPGMPAPPARFFGISPESGTTITNLEDEFIVGWENLPEGTNFIILNFINEATGITEGSGAFFITQTSGEKTFTFSNFNFEKNGLFRLFAGGGIKLGLIILPVWIEVSPAYYINLNIEGYPGYFQMPDWLDWYHANAMFDEPTDIFSVIGGFMGPLYDKIGEFGDRAATFLNTDDAYNYGYNLGLVFPTLRHYVNAIEVFFGGFPIITIFLVVLILLLAIFIFRLILKFIPGLG